MRALPAPSYARTVDIAGAISERSVNRSASQSESEGQQHPEPDRGQTGGEYCAADNADQGVREADRAAHDIDHHADRARKY